MPAAKLRIAVVTTHPPGTGTLNEYGYHFVRFLRRKPEVGEVILLADVLPSGERYGAMAGADPEEAPMRTISCWRFGDPLNAARVVAAVRRANPDIVLFNIQFASFGGSKVSAVLGLLAPALVKAAGFPTIVLLHNIMETVDLKSAGFAPNPLAERAIRAFGSMVTRLLLRSDLVALTIPTYVEILRAKYGAENVLLAPHGAFDESVPSFELAAGPLRILTFGKFGTYKRVETLIEAFKLLQQRPHGEGIDLVIAGTDSPNATGYLEEMRRQHAGLPGLRFTGYVPEEDVARLFGEAAVVVFPYTSTTGSSGVLHQAGNYGKAVVLPQLGDLAELIAEEGYTGEFFQPESATSLAEALAKVLDDPEHRQALGMQNYLAARGLPIADVVDWYLLHAQQLLDASERR